MISLVSWLVYGVVVGSISRAIYRGETPMGWVPTIATGVAGSFLGGLLHGLISGSNESGIVFGVLGGVLACYLYTKWQQQDA